MTRYEIGTKRVEEILGSNSDKIIENFKKISPDFAKYVVEFGYGDLYCRKGLTDRTRELAAVSSIIGQGNTGLPLKAHIRGMLNVGWTRDEIIEVIIFLIGYVGFPKTVEAILSVQEVFNTIDAK